MKPAYYNEFDPHAAQWLRNLIAAGLIPAGDVDERSIVDVRPDDLAGYRQCHFFAGIGGWALACRLAGWPDDREIWTGSPPCQPFSVAGQQRGTDDDRHLWPNLFRIIRARRPAVFMGEQVAAAVGKHWLDGVLTDLEGISYAGRSVVVPACAVDAPHRRDRLWLVAHPHGERRFEAGRQSAGDLPANRDWSGNRAGDGSATAGCARGGDVAYAESFGVFSGIRDSAGGNGPRDGRCVETGEQRQHANHGSNGAQPIWGRASWIIGHDGKARRVGSEICQLVDGFPGYLDGLCADYFAEAAEAVRNHGTKAFTRPAEVLREVFQAIHSEPEADWKMGVAPGVRTAEVLLAYVRQLTGRCGIGGGSQQIEEVALAQLRSLRDVEVSPCASHRRESSEQRPEQHSDAVQALSRVLASHAAATWEAYGQAHARPMALLAHNVPNRVGKLRALGNAIVPQVAAEVIGSYLDCYP